MKRVLYAALAASAVLVSCQREEFEEPFYGYDELNAVIEEVEMTRTYKDESNNVLWSEDDRIVAFMKSTQGTQYKVKSGGKPTASFTKVPSDDLVSGSAIDHVVAYYPYSDMIECEKVSGGYSMNVVLPSEQVYAEESFGNGSLPMASISSDNNITFRNVSGAMKLQLKGTAKVKSVKVEGKKNEKLSGAATVTVYKDGSKPSVSMASGASASVLLDCADGVQLSESTATEFIISLPPIVFSKGFTVEITDVAGSVYTIDTDKRNEVKRSSLLIMPEFVLDMSHREPMEGDYIDEYGINHGQGIEIDGTVWAPVNCGYHETDFKYGKLYQWGRKYGQGYDDNDVAAPTISSAPVSILAGNDADNANVYYQATSDYYNWCSPASTELWNVGTDSSPVKTEYDPCPEGWRVPTYSEINTLHKNKSSWTKNDKGQYGYWFSGTSSYAEGVPQVFLPASGRRDDEGNAVNRGSYGEYWSSYTWLSTTSKSIFLRNGFVNIYHNGYNRVRGYSVRCVKDDNELVEVSSITIGTSSLSLTVGQASELSASISPSDANHKNPFWYSSDEAVATVDKTGKVTAVAAGSATITAVAGMQSTTCEITVTTPSNLKDYIDEYGINQGPGVEIDGVIWAPVNCGYHASDFKYGKHYQWGRKYGQGYSGYLYDYNSTVVSDYSDASSPAVQEGALSIIDANQADNSDVFYTDWDFWMDGRLWNLSTESDPSETEYDPCPDGWRIPTATEWDNLSANSPSWEVSTSGQLGYNLTGTDGTKLFLPASGILRNTDGASIGRGFRGYYWSSSPESIFANYLSFGINGVEKGINYPSYGYAVRCVQSDEELVEVSSITISSSSYSLFENEIANLSVVIAPSNANHNEAFWYSSDEAVATVDQTGKVTAIAAGSATITAVAGMQCATCDVIVTIPSNTDDYIDEYGINQGPGIEIGGVIWAPVNCGYHETDFKYGKLYQWGRKYGQGYDGHLYDSEGIRIGDYSDVKDPIIKVGSVLATDANVLYAADVFYTGIGLIQNNWCYSMNSQLWNSGTEEFPVKTENDPCPSGWRVPTSVEAVKLNKNQSEMMADESGIYGKWLCGENEYTESVPRVFFPASGYRYFDGEASYRGCYGGYWTSKLNDNNPGYIGFSYNGKMSMGKAFCAHACAVRCVQDETEFVDVSSVEISASSINLLAGESYALSAAVIPSNSTLKSVSWYSSDVSVAVVDGNGKVTGVSKGNATIIASSGACSARCDISVNDNGGNEIYYIDENGVNRGQAVKIGETVWAPVNCGYHETDYKYGKMYQWGRKYGQGFTGDESTPSDGYYLQISSLAAAFDEKYAYYFFRNQFGFSAANELSEIINWNFGTEESPVKTQYDPCPMGWRVPTLTEFKQLIAKHSSRVIDDDTGITGMWFSGSSAYTESAPRIFLPVAGYLYWQDKNVPDYKFRGTTGSYYTSSSKYYQADYYEFGVGIVSFNTVVYSPTYDNPSSYGRSVRCVQE